MKEAIKKLEEALDYKGDYAYDFICKKISQALAILSTEPKCKTCEGTGRYHNCDTWGCSSVDHINKAEPCPDCTEQPNCEGCEFFKHTHSNEHCYRYTEARSLCKLRQELVEQPPAGELAKRLRAGIRLRDNRDKCGDPVEVIIDIKLINEACTRLDRSESIVKEYGGQRCTAICSRCKRISHWCLLPQGHAGEHIHYCQFKFLESSRKELLTACEKIQQYNKASEKGQLNPDDAHDYWDSVMSYIDVAIEKANKQGKCGERKRKLC